MSANVPLTSVIGKESSWVSILAGYSNATHDLILVVEGFTIPAIAQPSPQIGWTLTSKFLDFITGAAPWTASVKNKDTGEVTEVETGSIFLESQEYSNYRAIAEDAEAAISLLLKDGGYQTLSIKGRSSSAYGLADLQKLALDARFRMSRLENGGGITFSQAVF
jgi:hypothetical protein